MAKTENRMLHHSTQNPTRTDDRNTSGTTGWLTTQEAADYARVSKRTIHTWRKTGLKHVKRNNKTVRILPADIDEFLFLDYTSKYPDLAELKIESIVKKITSRKK
jgi:excisionase family DNA binding protein